MKQAVFLAVVLTVAAAGVTQGGEGQLRGMAGLGVDSQYIWRGFDVYPDKGAVHLMADLDFFQSGFGVNVTGHRATAGGFENGERWDYTLYYQTGIYAGEPHATNIRAGYVYYNYPDHSMDWFDLQEGHLILSWPNALPVEGLQPSYVLVKIWPSKGAGSRGKLGHNASGWLHILMLDYGFMVPGILPERPEQLIKVHSELVYNDGFHPAGRNVINTWSHAVLGVSTDFDLGYGFTLTPAVYYQRTFERTVNLDDNELWAGLSVRYAF